MSHREDVWDDPTHHVLKIPVVWAAPADEQVIAGTITESNEVLDKWGLQLLYIIISVESGQIATLIVCIY